MSTQVHPFRPRAVGSRPVALGADQRISDLLARYPNISGADEREILSFLKRAKYLDIALLKSDRSVQRQLDLFIRSHTRALKYSAPEVIAIACMVLAFLAACWLLWQATAFGGA